MLLAATAALDAKHVLCSDELAAPLRELLPQRVCVLELGCIVMAATEAARDGIGAQCPLALPDDIFFYQARPPPQPGKQ